MYIKCINQSTYNIIQYLMEGYLMPRIKRHQKKKIKPLIYFIIFIFLCVLTLFIIIRFSLKLSNNNTNNLNLTIENNIDNSSSKNAQNVTTNAVENIKTPTNSLDNAANSTATNNSNTPINESDKDISSVPSNSLNTSSMDSKGNSLSVEEAQKILKSKIENNSNSKVNINYDHLQEKNDNKYYVFQVFTAVNTNSSNENHSNTLGWYYVNTNTSEVYILDLNTNILNSIK